MFRSVKDYVYERRSGLSKTVCVSGGLYVARRYLRERLEEVKWKLEQEQSSRDALKRRFRQTQEDVSYTVLAILPTLAEQLLQQMDIEALTQELKKLSKAKKKEELQHQISSSLISLKTEPENASPKSIASSLVSSAAESMLSPQEETKSEEGSASQSTVSFDMAEAPPSPAISNAASWVEASASVSQLLPSNQPSSSRASHTGDEDESHLSASIISLPVSDSGSTSSESRSKAELWNEVKILTLTRLMTSLYSTTLLCLLTTIQLTLLARGRYVHSVVEQEKEERMREEMDALSISGLLMKQLMSSRGLGGGIEQLISGIGEDDQVEEGEFDEEWEVPEETKNKYLTMSWWLLHVGCKDVGERVRRGVEEVFEGVSLKTPLAAIDLHRLVGDIRRRVEHEVTFEGRERRVNFLSTLLPPTAETIQHVLVQGGISPSRPGTINPPIFSPSTTTLTSNLSSSQLSSAAPLPPLTGQPPDASTSQPSLHVDPYMHLSDLHFSKLVNETRQIVNGPDFARVLEVCLDRAVAVLFEGLEGDVFVGEPGQGAPRVRLASLLPGLARWSQRMVLGLPNELIDVLLDVREVQCLSAIAFSKFDEKVAR